jgi:phosphoribosylanthranilate isomerase
MIKIKVCGLRDPQNIENISRLGVDYMGFIFYRDSLRYVGDAPDATIFKKCNSQTLKVGVFVNEEQNKIIETGKKFALNLIQLHGNENNTFCAGVKASGFGVIKTFAIDYKFDFDQLVPYMSGCDYFLFDNKTPLHGGSGEQFCWDILNSYQLEKPFFLSGGIGADDAVTIRSLNHKMLFAVDINSRFENMPGLKNTGEVERFVKEIKKT